MTKEASDCPFIRFMSWSIEPAWSRKLETSEIAQPRQTVFKKFDSLIRYKSIDVTEPGKRRFEGVQIECVRQRAQFIQTARYAHVSMRAVKDCDGGIQCFAADIVRP